MQALIVHPPAPGIERAEVPAPSIPAGGVRVELLEVGVCGTDQEIVAGRYGTPPPGADYLILGHENLGRVAETSPGVTAPSVGDLVVATVRRGCGLCRFCRAGRSDFCETGRFTERGISGAHGYFADEYTERPSYLVRVPAGLGETAVLLEPLSVVEKAIEQGEAVARRKEPTPGEAPDRAPTALVAGTGAVGMLASFVLRRRGYEVVAIDRHDGRTPAASLLGSIGARHVNAAAGLDSLGSARFDLVVEATGSASLDLALVDRLAVNGVLVLTGIPDAATPPAPVAGGAILRGLVLGNRAIVGSVNANRAHFEAGLADLAAFEARWPGAVARVVSDRRPISAFAEVLGRRSPPGTKTVLTVRPGAAAR
jgi:glucose 1-dehydrogenase